MTVRLRRARSCASAEGVRAASGVRAVAIAVLAGALSWSAAARADGPVPPLTVNMYDVAPACPVEGAFRAEIDRHTHGVSAPIQVKVWIEAKDGGFEGTLDVVDVAGARSTRNVKSPRCDEVVNAFALVVALAVDDAIAAPPPEPPPPPPLPPPQVVPNVAPSSLAASRDERHDEVHADHLVLRAGADGAVELGATPQAVVGVPLFVEITKERGHPGVHLEPRARLAWTFAANDDASIAAGAATFHWTAGALDLCPIRLAFVTLADRTLADLRACARFEVGIVSGAATATATGPKPTGTDHEVWVAAGVPLTFRIELAKWLFVELEGAVRAPLVRPEFRVGAADSLLFQPPHVGGDGALGAGVIFR